MKSYADSKSWQTHIDPKALADIQHLDLANKLVFDENNFRFGGYADYSTGKVTIGYGDIKVAVKRLEPIENSDIHTVCLAT